MGVTNFPGASPWYACAVGCDKLMFGTGWPLIRPYIEFVGTCDFLSDAEHRIIMFDNANCLYWKAPL